MSERQETPDDARRGGFGALGWVVVLVLILYPLSTGPAMKLIEHGVLNEKPVGYFYAPLGWLAAHSPPVADFFDWYLGDVWGGSIFK